MGHGKIYCKDCGKKIYHGGRKSRNQKVTYSTCADCRRRREKEKRIRK